jgi:hypothetical protein
MRFARDWRDAPLLVASREKCVTSRDLDRPKHLYLPVNALAPSSHRDPL